MCHTLQPKLSAMVRIRHYCKMKSIENYRIEMTSGYSFWTFLSFLSRFARAIAENEAMPNLFMFFNPIWKIESENDLNVLCVCMCEGVWEQVRTVDCNSVWPTELTRKNWIYHKINMRRVNVCVLSKQSEENQNSQEMFENGKRLRVFQTVLLIDAAKTTS